MTFVRNRADSALTVNIDISYSDATTLLGWDYIQYINGWPVLVY